MSSEISQVIKIIAKESKRFKLSSVSEVSLSQDPYKVLISCILSLRTRDATTYPAASRLFKLADSPEKMIKLDTEVIERTIYPVGFYKQKAITIKDVSNILIDKYNSKVPDDINELLKLKGVGRKTANIVVVYGYDKPGLPIDTHCHRIPNRLGWISTKTPEETEQELRKLIPKQHWKTFNDVFVAFGQNICKPIGPKCSICPVKSPCDYGKQNDAQTTHRRRTSIG